MFDGELTSIHGMAKPLMITLVCLSIGTLDLIYKFCFKHDATIMDSFLKTRPIPESLWERFLIISQLWHPDNLLMPLIILPICIAVFHFWGGIVAFLFLYFMSVCGGIFMMEAKRKSNYCKEEKNTKNSYYRIFNNIFGIQSKCTFRTRRLRKALFLVIALFVFLPFFQHSEDNELLMFMVPLMIPYMIGQFGFGIEANFFNAIWTKPVKISRILNDKYLFLCGITVVATIIFALFGLFMPMSFKCLACCSLYAIGVADLIVLLDCFNCSRFDLDGNFFYNSQGTEPLFRPQLFIPMLLVTSIGIILLVSFDKSLLGGIGILGFALHRPIFRWEEKKFLNNRYKYMEKYSK